jgi:CDP-diacylglycerol--glycerol-3-phosphate 3-phosphatidyltransferase
MITIKDLPNILTISRIAIIPVIIILFYLENSFSHQISAGLFLFAALTDFLDGYLARSWSIQSNLGRFLDPIADKLLVGAIIMMLVHLNKAHILPSLAIICREILVSGLREFLAEIRVSVPVSKLAKLKTFVQMGAMFILILGSAGSGIVYADMLGQITLWIAAALTIFTGYAYLKAGLIYMSDNN